MSTRFQFDSYARKLDTPHRLTDVQLRRVVLICILLLVAVIVFAIKATAQEVPPGVPLAETILRDSAGSLGTGTQPPFAPTTRPASSSHLLPLALTYAGLQAVDLFQTTSALNSGRYREANGALSSIAGSPWKLGLVKGAVTSGSLLGIYAMRKAHPKASKWLLVGVVSAQAVVVGWNAKEMR